MFVHETHSFYIIVHFLEYKEGSENYLSKKQEIFEKALSNIGGFEKLLNHDNIWNLKDVMYSRAEDVFDIINNEMIRVVTKDESVSTAEKKVYELHKGSDKVIISEYSRENNYTFE